MSLELSLYQLESQLAELVEMREAATSEAEIAALDGVIADYLRAEIGKVDGIRAFWRHCETMIEAAKRERDAQNTRIQTWTGRLDRLKRTCCMVMESMPWRESARSKKLEGRTGALLLKADGGKQAVEITDEALIPDEFKRVTVTLSRSAWLSMVKEGVYAVSESFNLSAINDALAKPCSQCEGVSDVVDSVTGEKYRVASTCSACGGTGKNGVPGARLVPRGNHVECK